MSHEYPFRCHPSVVAHARQWIETGVSAALPAHPSVAFLIDNLLIVASELVTNAVMHGGSSGILQWSVDDARFMEVAVTDDIPGWPMARRAGPDDEHGRGLVIVMRLCQWFGVEPDGRGVKRVWGRLAVHPDVANLILDRRQTSPGMR